MTRRPPHGREQGFTLIELLVVIIILGILSAVVVFAVKGADDKGKRNSIASDARTLRTAQEAFCATHGRYAVDMEELVNGPAGVPGARGFLSEPSTLNSIRAATDTEPRPCNGTGYVIDTVKDTVPPLDPGCTDTGPWCSLAPDPPAVGYMVQLTSPGLNQGKVFVAGYTVETAGNGTKRKVNWTGFYDPSGPGPGTWSATTPLPTGPDFLHYSVWSRPVELTGTATQCGGNCGKVLVPLGYRSPTGTGWQLFDPTDLTWENVGVPETPVCVCFRQAVPLRNGKVLAFRGDDAGNFDLYDPAATDPALAFTPIPGSAIGLGEPAVVPMKDDPAGRVLVVSSNGPVVKMYDPENGFSTVAAYDPEPFLDIPATKTYGRGDVTALPGGRALAMDGGKADIFDVDDNQWSPASSCGSPATLPGVTGDAVFCTALGSLPDGKVLAFTNPSGSPPDLRTWLFDPSKPNDQQWTQTADDLASRASTAYSVFVDGTCGNCNRLLVTGEDRTSSGYLVKAELYTPSGP